MTFYVWQLVLVLCIRQVHHISVKLQRNLKIMNYDMHGCIFRSYLRGEIDLERERTGLRAGGERLRLRLTGDLLGGGGLLGRLRGELSEKKQMICYYKGYKLQKKNTSHKINFNKSSLYLN